MPLHSAIQSQQEAKQPRLIFCFAVSLVAAHGVGFLAAVLRRIHPLGDWMAARPLAFTSIYYGAIYLILVVSSLYFLIRYRAALFPNREQAGERLPTVPLLLICGPLVIYYVLKIPGSYYNLRSILDLGPASISELFENLCRAHGTSTSVYQISAQLGLALVFPVLEEVLFTGFILNRLLRRFPVGPALATCAVLFTLAHLPNEGLSLNLLFHALLSIACQLIRLSSGRIHAAIFYHIFINFLIIIPQSWIITAYYAFSRPEGV